MTSGGRGAKMVASQIMGEKNIVINAKTKRRAIIGASFILSLGISAQFPVDILLSREKDVENFDLRSIKNFKFKV